MYGNVHIGHHLKTKQKCAIKIVKKAMFNKYPILEQLTHNEISVLKKLKNPNIIEFVEIMRSSNNTYYVYEYCNGGNLFDFVKKNGKLSEKQAMIYFKQLLNACKDMVA